MPDVSTQTAPAHERSEATVNPALRIFKVPPTDISINAYRMVTIQPTTTGINPMEFIIPGLDDFVDLGRSYFTMELRLKKEYAGNLVAAEKLWPVNNLAHSIIKQIDLQLNGTLISPQSDTYHYKAYLETLLNYDREDGKTVLGPQGWFNQVDFPPQWTANNRQSRRPCSLASSQCQSQSGLGSHGSRNRQVCWRCHPQSGVYPPPGSLSHRQTVGAWHRNQDEISFQWPGPVFQWSGSEAGRLMEGDVKLRFHLCQLRLNDAIYQSLSEKRHNEGQVASYPTVRSEIRTFTMQDNLVRFDIPNLFQNRIPDRLIVGLLDSRAFNGDVTRDPFCFQKFGLSSIKQIVRGEEYPYETLQLVHNNGTRDNLGYFRFLQASGAWCKKKGNMVELGDWGQAKNCTLYMFDNVANGCADSQNLNPKQTGDLQLVLEFGAAPGVNITVLVYGEFENLLEIDRNGAVLYNIYQH